MLEQIRNIDNIYDLLAMCSSYILNELDGEKYEFALFNDDDYDQVYDAVQRYCCECRHKGSKSAFEELRDYLISFMGPESTVEKCFAVVKYIDELVEVEVSGSLLGGKHIIKYSSLNEQYDNRVRIIPKMKGTFLENGDLQFRCISGNEYSLFRDRRECACSILDSETVNYMIWDKQHIDDYPTFIYRFDKKSSVVKHFYERRKIVFGIVPFTDKSLKEILDVRYDNRAFYIQNMHMDAEQELKERYKSICSRCEQEDIDFLIFPEMLMTENIISAIQNKEKVLSPKIIVNGSIWKDYMNKSVITDGTGKEIFNYCKKQPYEYEDKNIKYREFLKKEKNRDYTILEIEGLGRVGVGICRDLINEKVKLFHKYMGTDLLIIPACTSSMDLQSSAENLSKEYNCVVVVANTCSALEGEREGDEANRIGFITLPAKNSTDRSNILRRYTRDVCAQECVHRCIGKKFIINFYQTKEYPEGTSYELEEAIF
ncbi:carbon-nitrogen hydrolase family protein [Lachnospiraceae bacterium]|nr:carbon-nitrogen hydrolase family protein [Lachnospiraceae bacterium]